MLLKFIFWVEAGISLAVFAAAPHNAFAESEVGKLAYETVQLSGSAEEKKSLRERPFLGIGYQYLSGDGLGEFGLEAAYLVAMVIRDSAAEHAGLHRGDHIVEFDDMAVISVEQEDKQTYFSQHIRNPVPGDPFHIKILRVIQEIEAVQIPSGGGKSYF